MDDYSKLASEGKKFKSELTNWRKDKFKEWCENTVRAIDDPSQALRFIF